MKSLRVVSVCACVSMWVLVVNNIDSTVETYSVDIRTVQSKFILIQLKTTISIRSIKELNTFMLLLFLLFCCTYICMCAAYILYLVCVCACFDDVSPA